MEDMGSTHVDLRGLSWSRQAGSIASDGAFLKATSADKSIFYKMSAYNASQGVYSHEAINELIAYRVAVELGIPVPETYLVNALVSVDDTEFRTQVAVSKTFKMPNDTRAAYEDFYTAKREVGETALSVALRFGWADRVYQMFLFDFLIFSRDRHGANLEVLENNEKRRLSPLFDNGLSLTCTCSTDSELSVFDVMADRKVNNFIGTRSLYQNLELIKAPVPVQEFSAEAKSRIFYGMDTLLTDLRKDTIWALLWGRWLYAKKFCDLRPGA
ncbi:MAG: hypothetical protein LBH09_02665 [Peptococcaceae bacterium]|jgi:hypothetical protein|nr:hypothetical protein [Peptococcaceae bacterium]